MLKDLSTLYSYLKHTSIPGANFYWILPSPNNSSCQFPQIFGILLVIWFSKVKDSTMTVFGISTLPDQMQHNVFAPLGRYDLLTNLGTISRGRNIKNQSEFVSTSRIVRVRVVTSLG